MLAPIFHPQNTTIICPKNDLEAISIISIAKRIGFDVVEGPKTWGATLGDILQTLIQYSLKDNLLIIEMPGDNATKLLTKLGKRVTHIDHHSYNKYGDLSHPLSSLEQFSDLIGYPLSKHERLIAINDRDFIPGLAAAGCSYAEMMNIREQEATARGVSILRQEALEWLKSKPINQNGFWTLEVPKRFSPVFAEVAQLPSEQVYVVSQKQSKPLVLQSVFLKYVNGSYISQIEVCSSAKHKTFFNNLSKYSTQSIRSWFGVGANNMFFGAKLICDTPTNELFELIALIQSYTENVNDEYR